MNKEGNKGDKSLLRINTYKGGRSYESYLSWY